MKIRILAICAALCIGAALAPVAANAARPQPLVDTVSVPGVVAEMKCSGGALSLLYQIHNPTAYAVTGDIKVYRNGVEEDYVAATRTVQAGQSYTVSGGGLFLDYPDIPVSYTTAYLEFTPAGSVWKIKKIHVDFPDNKDCS